MYSRTQSEADLYHVVARGTGRQLIFEDDSDCRLFLKLLKEGLDKHDVELYAWCLMGNHVHLLVHAPMASVSKLMKQVLGTYAMRFNLKTGRVGHLFQSRFRSEPIADESYLLTVMRYIHENPVKAGIGPIDSYPWSSYREYIGRPRICQTAFLLEMLGGVSSFRAFHERYHDEGQCLDIDSERNATRGMPDGRAIEIAEAVLDGAALNDVKTFPPEQRTRCLRSLTRAGLTVRQIERLTGIGRNTVARS